MWHLNKPPYSVQAEAIKRSATRGAPGYGYFMEMGLGKTAVAMNDFVSAAMADRALFHLVICPNSLRSNWRIEAEEFGLNMPTILWDGDSSDVPEPPFQFIINYEALLYSGGKFVYNLLKKYDRRVFITADETSRIKNFQASTTKIVNDMGLYSCDTRALTGTPMANNVMDLWPQLRFVRSRARGMNPYQFRNKFAVMGGYLGKQVVGMRNEEELRTILDECSFTALKSDWTDLPPKVFPPPRQVQLSKRQAELYKEMEEDFMIMLDDDAVTAPMVITALEKLQQISSGFIFKEDGECVWLVEPKLNPKLTEMKNVMEETAGKCLVFCTHRPVLTMLELALLDWKPAVMRGGMPDGYNDDQKRRFNEDHECRALVAQSSVGGMGHTLLGSGPGVNRCTTVHFFENSFNLIYRVQSEDRPHRHGQDADCVTYLDYICSRVEAKIVKALQKKLDLIRFLRNRNA